MGAIVPGATGHLGMKAFAALLLALAAAACSPPPDAGHVEEHRASVVVPGPIFGTLNVKKRIQFTRYWDGVLSGAWPAVYGSVAQPPAANIGCPRMWVYVQRQVKLTTGQWIWEDPQYGLLVDPTAISLSAEGFFNGPTSSLAYQYCDYQVCRPGTSVQNGTCQPLDLKYGPTTVWMTPACPGDPNRGVGGIPEFNGSTIMIGQDANWPNTPYAQNMVMPTWAGPFGQKRMWRDWTSQCGMGPGPAWSEPTTVLKIEWCQAGGIGAGGSCLPGSLRTHLGYWQL